MDHVEEVATPEDLEARVRFRTAVSLFATGIAVVTVEGETVGSVHGMTINSFTSISLDPPTVMISLKPGRTHNLISEHGRYGVSILHDGQETYSAQFSGRPNPDLTPEFEVYAHVPVLRSSLAWFDCEVIERVKVHDHTLFIAKVVACQAAHGAPLVFFASQYHKQKFWI